MADNLITVLAVEPNEAPVVRTISNDLQSLQKQVGGRIEAVYPFADDVVLIMNEEGKLLGLPDNRTLYDDSGKPFDIIAGTFLVAGLDEENFCSLTPEQVKVYQKMYAQPERFAFTTQGKIAVMPIEKKTKSVCEALRRKQKEVRKKASEKRKVSETER